MIEFDNGYYQGEVFNNKREGFGVFYWDSGQLYLGKWSKDHMEEEGVVYFSDGGCVYGNFRRNKLSGYACVLDPSDNMIVGHFSKGVLESGVWNEKLSGKWFRYDVQNCKPNRECELTTKSQIPQIVTLKEVIKKIFHDCQGRKCVKYIEYIDTTFYVGVTNDNGKSPAGLGVLHDSDNKVMQVGYFKICKSDRNLLIINDKKGTQFFIRDRKFFYGFFNGNQIKKIIKSGTGYPNYLLGYYKHPSKYAQAKVDKVQEQEVMQDLQNLFMNKYQAYGYSEIYKSSPKKKNLLLFVEIKFSEDFISPNSSVYQEVLEATQYARSQHQNSSHSPIRKKQLQLNDDDHGQSKQITSKISPSSSSSYTPSNIRLKQSNQNTSKSQDIFNNSTDKKKSKSTDNKQKNFFSTQKKKQSNQQQQQQSQQSKQDSQHIFIQDGSDQRVDSQYLNQSLRQYNTEHPQKQRTFQNSNESSIQDSAQQQKSRELDNYIIKINGNNESRDFNNDNYQSFEQSQQDQLMNVPELAQNAVNQFKKNSITSSLSNNSKQYLKNSISSSTHKQSISQSIQLGDDLNKQQLFYQPINSNEEDIKINQHQQRDENERKSSLLSNPHSQYPQKIHQSSKLNKKEEALDFNQLDDELKQIQQLQELLQSFNGANQTLNKKIRESTSLHLNNSQEDNTNTPINQVHRNSLLNNQIGNAQLNNQKRNSQLNNYNNYLSDHQQSQHQDNEYRNLIPDDQLVHNIQETIQQRFSEQFNDNIPNTMQPDQKISTSRQLSSERHIEESSQTNDRRKNETPRFDLVFGKQKLLNELESSYKNASSEVSSLYTNMQNELSNLKSDSILEKNKIQQNSFDISTNNQSNSELNFQHNRRSLIEQNNTNNFNSLSNQQDQNEVNKILQNENNYQSIQSNFSQNERKKQQPILSQKPSQQMEIDNSNVNKNSNDFKENNNNAAYSTSNQQFYYKLYYPQQPTVDVQDEIQEDIIEQLKKMRNNAENNKQRSRKSSQNSQSTPYNNQQNLQIQQNDGYLNEQEPDNQFNYNQKQGYHFQNENQRRNSFEKRDKLESIQLPKTPINMLQQSPQGYSYQERRGSNNIADFNLNAHHQDNIQLEGIKQEDSIHQSEQQSQQIVQKVKTLNKDDQRIKTNQNDSFECNIYQESQNDFIDSQGNNFKSEDYYKSLMQTIPENKEGESTHNSQIYSAKFNKQLQIEYKIKGTSVQKDNQHLDSNQFGQMAHHNNILTNQIQNNRQQFQQMNQLSLRDEQNTTLDDENEEGKTKFKYINYSPSKPISQSSINIKKRKRIFDTALNNSFSVTSPNMSRYGLSPISQQMNVIIPTNNDQRISDFNINSVISNYNQNKQDQSPLESNGFNQFNRDNNRLNSNSSFDQMNINENQLIFNNPQYNQAFEYSTQNKNNFNSNATHLRYKSQNSNQQLTLPNQLNQQHQNNNWNQQQFQSRNNNHQRIYSQHNFNSQNINSTSFEGFNNRLSTLPNNNQESQARLSYQNNFQQQFNSQYNQQGTPSHSKLQGNNYIQSNESRIKQQDSQLFFQLQNESKVVSDKLIAQQLQPNNHQNSTLKPDVRSLRQIMNVSMDKGLSPKQQGFFQQNGLQTSKATLITNIGCQPVQSFTSQIDSDKNNKEQYNSIRCSFSRNLQQSLNELNEQNQSFTSSSHQQNYQLNTQNDTFYEEENNNKGFMKNNQDQKQKQSTQFLPVNNSFIQSKENNVQYPQHSHKEKPNKFKFNINLTDISNERLTPEKSNPRQSSLTPSSQKTISLSKLQKITDERQRNEGILDQFMSVKSNLKNEFQQSAQQSYDKQYFTQNKNKNI